MKHSKANIPLKIPFKIFNIFNLISKRLKNGLERDIKRFFLKGQSDVIRKTYIL